MKYSILVILLIGFGKLNAQLPYTQNRFNFDTAANIVYANDTDYAGNTVNLLLDIYKPINDSNCLRPLMILVHGGAWIGGSKEDVNMAYMSRELAKKGWVVANINYRLGTHKAANYTMYPLCNTSLSQPCGYISDSAEIYRAIFRGMQDAKSAIRYMKNRSTLDSTDIGNVYIAGESAGGFIALAAAYTDMVSEKHAACYAIGNAANPDSDMNTYSCVPSPMSTSRPDLGSIEGKFYFGKNDASVKGVGNFYGAVCNLNIFNQSTDTPLLYLFHQGSDVVVHYGRGIILGRTSYECYGSTNICQPYYFYPIAYGSESIRSFLSGNGRNPKTFKSDIIYNYSYQNNCFSNGHSIDNINRRLDSMLSLFTPEIAKSGNDPALNCNKLYLQENSKKQITIYPNPAETILNIEHSSGLPSFIFHIYNSEGKSVLNGIITGTKSTIDLRNLPEGIYYFKSENGLNYRFSILR